MVQFIRRSSVGVAAIVFLLAASPAFPQGNPSVDFTLSLTGMNPHVGQMLSLRIIDLTEGIEVTRDTVAALKEPAFDWTLPDVLYPDRTYRIDFWADHNGNGQYDAPPADHAWRAEFAYPASDHVVAFAHNTSFTDIAWPQSVVLRFTGMTPHLHQNLHARLVDIVSGFEAGRASVVVPGSAFDFELIGARSGRSYYIDFYADHSNNDQYDAPPTDHAWRLILVDVHGDTVVPFAHNTNFTDIDWRYVLRVNFMEMDPHLGQQFHIRAVDLSTGAEIARESRTIQGSEFVMSIPGVELGKFYNVAFWTDHNGNGRYDSPPADHAWRIVAQILVPRMSYDFHHNTTFNDIVWPNVVTVDFRNMTPHVNQDFHLRLVDDQTGAEIQHRDITAIPTASFLLPIPGILRDTPYRLDFYADHSGNDQYDAPPVDHAWRIIFTAPAADTTIPFLHNIGFTDIESSGPSAIRPDASRPVAFDLVQNRPNPFNPSTAITFDVANPARVRIGVYNAIGQHVRTLVDASYLPGRYEATWDGRRDSGADMASGIYFVRMTAPGFIQTRRIALVR